MGLLHRVEVSGHFHDTKLRGIALGRQATLAHFSLGEAVAAFAAAQRFQCDIQGKRQALRPALIMLQQMIGHALGRLRTHARQAAQCPDQLIETR